MILTCQNKFFLGPKVSFILVIPIRGVFSMSGIENNLLVNEVHVAEWEEITLMRASI